MAQSVEISLPNGLNYEQPTGLFINNEFIRSKSGKTFSVLNPSTEENIVDLYEADQQDVETAVEAADAAFKKWRFVNPQEKSRLLYKLADLIEEDKEILTSIESLNNGKSFSHASFDVNIVITYLRSCAGYADKIDGRLVNTGPDYLNFTKREPLGICGQIIPWNFPIMMWAWKIGPALVSGNVVILKPASATPLSALYVSTLCVKAGIPAGVINIIPGSGRKCGDAILKHPKIKKIAFTGSTEIGRDVMVAAAQSNLKKVTLELGGKSPNIVLNDADIEKTVPNLIRGIFFNGGEVCCAGSRIYIQDGIYDKILPVLIKAAKEIKVGDPFEKGVYQGAQATKSQFETVLRYIEIGKKEGATLLAGGKRVGTKGFFVEPTIFGDVNEQMTIRREEVFGPVVTVSKFSTIDQVLEWANDSEYGLGSGIHTENISNAIYIADRLEAGSVWVNTYNDLHANMPFGGYKESGMGREMGIEALENYTQVKAVRIKLN